MKLKLLIGSLLLSVFSFGQSLTITSQNEVCVDELISFQASSSSTITSTSWNFGDNTSSTQSSPGHSYSSYGSKTVTLTVTFQDGSTGSVTKDIMVHDLPQPDFTQFGDYCLSDHSVCLEDKSSMGSTTNGYQSRIILWGTGAASTSTVPFAEPIVCHTAYPSAGDFHVVVEVVNNKGCEAKYFDTITILQDYNPSFRINKQPAGCNEQEFCFINANASKPANVVSWTYDFGDGSSSTNEDWGSNCHTFTSEGRFTVTLSVTLANGCVNTFTNSVVVSFVKLDIDLILNDTTACFPSHFQFQNASSAGSLRWLLYDENLQYLSTIGNQKSAVFYPECPGDYYVQLHASLGACKDSSRMVLVKSNGFLIDYVSLNNQLCSPGDTTYFLNTSKYHPDARTRFNWKMGDDQAPRCSTSRNNCEFETDTNAYHLYPDYSCYKPVLTLYDSVSGCSDTKVRTVAIDNIDSIQVFADVPLPCIGSKPEYEVTFEHNLCNPKVSILFDSGRLGMKWHPSKRTYIYTTTTDSLGRVTVGWAFSSGNVKKYLSADTNDYIVDSTRLCIDTIWKHHWFQLTPEPKLDFEFVRDTLCLPTVLTLKYTGSEEGRLAYAGIRWRVKDSIQYTYLPDDTIPDQSHTYYEADRHFLYRVIKDTLGCYSYDEPEEFFGYINRIEGNENICVGDSLQLTEVLRYIDDNYWYWEDSNRVEKKYWDFDDGNGFADSSDNPSVMFPNKGIYTIRMATTDSIGCTDTAELRVVVGGVNAGIKEPDDELLCDQIVQLFDSSYSDFANFGDTIKSHFWEFGDYTSPNFLPNPFHYYSSNGTFTVRHAVTSVSGCSDTAEIEIFILGPEPKFSICTDSFGCAPLTVDFKSHSQRVTQFLWYMGDPNNTTISAKKDTAFSFTYNQPGVYDVYLSGLDSFFNKQTNNVYSCRALYPDSLRTQRIYKRITVYPILDVDFLPPSPICTNQVTTFIQTADTAYTKFNWYIDGDFIDSTDGNLSYEFASSGTYDVKLAPIYELLTPEARPCYDSISKTVTVNETRANFNVEAIGECSEFSFMDSSYNGIQYSWDFGNPGQDCNKSDKMNPTHSYGRDTGDFRVQLIVIGPEGCSDTAYKDLNTSFAEMLIPYNIFTPNGDGLNDGFVMDEINVEDFNLKIFNRWGENVFETQDPTTAWYGTDRGENELPASTYFYVLKYSFLCDDKIEVIEGQVELVR